MSREIRGGGELRAGWLGQTTRKSHGRATMTMFITETAYVSRRRKPRRRYWWAALAFVAGYWLGTGAAHLF
jgi:hypothetical protein